MTEGETKARGWSEHEKMGLFIQLAVRAGKIDWNEIDLPEGRTIKACQVMFDREKSKVKQATTTGEGASPAKGEKKTPAKRKAAAAEDGNDATPKKGKGAKAKKVKVEKAEVKSESAEEDAPGSPA